MKHASKGKRFVHSIYSLAENVQELHHGDVRSADFKFLWHTRLETIMILQYTQ